MNKKLFIGLALVAFGAQLNAQAVDPERLNRSPEDHLKSIKVQDVDMLIEVLNNDKIAPNIKIMALSRIGSMVRESSDALKEKNETLFTNVVANRDKFAGEEPKINSKVRQQAVLALGAFGKGAKASAAIAELKKSLLEDKSYDVVSSAAHVLREFENNRGEATAVLVEKIDFFLQKDVFTDEDIRITYTIISSMNQLKHKSGFIPLMKILQSGYPMFVKKGAEEALEKINWEQD